MSGVVVVVEEVVLVIDYEEVEEEGVENWIFLMYFDCVVELVVVFEDGWV